MILYSAFVVFMLLGEDEDAPSIPICHFPSEEEAIEWIEAIPESGMLADLIVEELSSDEIEELFYLPH